jgi:hypothetical protein
MAKEFSGHKGLRTLWSLPKPAEQGPHNEVSTSHKKDQNKNKIVGYTC